MNVNFLYPVVHDLTDAEYSVGCCAPSLACNPTGCFSLEDLIYPESDPVSIPPAIVADPSRQQQQQQQQRHQQQQRQQWKDSRRLRNGLFRRARSGLQRNQSSSTSSHMMAPVSLIDDRNDCDPNDERDLRFDDVYVLTRQV